MLVLHMCCGILPLDGALNAPPHPRCCDVMQFLCNPDERESGMCPELIVNFPRDPQLSLLSLFFTKECVPYLVATEYF